MMELAVYTHSSGQRWRLAWYARYPHVALESEVSQMGDLVGWLTVSAVAKDPIELGIRLGWERGSDPINGMKVMNPEHALTRLSLLVETHLTEQRMKQRMKPPATTIGVDVRPDGALFTAEVSIERPRTRHLQSYIGELHIQALADMAMHPKVALVLIAKLREAVQLAMDLSVEFCDQRKHARPDGAEAFRVSELKRAISALSTIEAP